MTLKVRAVILSDSQGHRDAVDTTRFRGDIVNIAETMEGPACQQDRNLWVVGRPIHWGGKCSLFFFFIYNLVRYVELRFFFG